MNPTVKRYIVSSITTFITVFITTAGLFVAAEGTVVWDVSFWSALLVAAARAGVKAVVEALPNAGVADK